MIRAEVQPEIERVSGYQGIVVLGDRSTGKSFAITFWDSEQAMQESRAAADQLRKRAADAEQASIRAVDECEVLMDERR